MSHDWFRCDGKGHSAPSRRTSSAGFGLSRRGLLAGVGAGALGMLAGGPALAQIAIDPAARGRARNVLVVLFLRGGADGLSLVVPYREAAYYRERPTLAIDAPRKSRLAAIDLDGNFGLHPSLGALLPLYREGKLAVFHACGSGDDTRSHFEAMSAMERGLAREGAGPASGWIARHLATAEREGDSPLRAVAIGSTMPDSLRGATNAVLMESLAGYRLESERREWAMRELSSLYGSGQDAVSEAGRQTLRALQELSDVAAAPSAAAYPSSDLGQGLRQVAILIRADLGLEVACLDKGGWDTHVGQGATTGWMPGLLDDLGRSLAAFAQDLGAAMARVDVVVISEFGRRLAENTGLGTDHGHGGVAFALGGGVRGGRVYGRWPGLDPERLTGPGDLQATTDYRDVLGELLARRAANPRVSSVFPGYSPRFIGYVGAV